MLCSVHSEKYSVKMSIVRWRNSITNRGGTAGREGGGGGGEEIEEDMKVIRVAYD